MNSAIATYLFLSVIALVGIACTYWSQYRHRHQHQKSPKG